jgi:hypothetical protein
MNDASADAAADLLTGCDDIAKHLGWTVRQVKHRVEKGELPTFTLGNGRTIYARRSTLAAHFAAQEQAARSGHTAPGA